jgi:hypothetical protein
VNLSGLLISFKNNFFCSLLIVFISLAIILSISEVIPIISFMNSEIDSGEGKFDMYLYPTLARRATTVPVLNETLGKIDADCQLFSFHTAIDLFYPLQNGDRLLITTVLFDGGHEKYVDIGLMHKLQTLGLGEVYITKTLSVFLNV